MRVFKEFGKEKLVRKFGKEIGKEFGKERLVRKFGKEIGKEFGVPHRRGMPPAGGIALARPYIYTGAQARGPSRGPPCQDFIDT